MALRLCRPGFFGSAKNERIAALNTTYGEGQWDLRWITEETLDNGSSVYTELSFITACRAFYEKSYFEYLRTHPEDLLFICGHREVIDNAETNILSGCDYAKQETPATHIQDITIRNVLQRLNRSFNADSDKILVVRGKGANGSKFGPGNIPFYNPELITQPSLRPWWANAGSVEDFWQSNKWVVKLNDGGSPIR
jgi:hypothetical protein